MENQELYNINDTTKEVVIIHKKGLDEKEPVQLKLSGNIDSPLRFLEKRVMEQSTSRVLDLSKGAVIPDNIVFPNDSHVIINREKMTITLIFNETDPLFNGKVLGQLENHPDFEKWRINTGNSWSHLKLSEFIKMNRYCFDDKDYAMKLSTSLADIKVKADSAYERSADQKGNTRFLVSKEIIQSNIPDSFTINVPLFKGQDKVSIEVELYVDPNSYDVTLNSPEANEIVDRYKETVITEQKDEIIKLLPLIPIIEQ